MIYSLQYSKIIIMNPKIARKAATPPGSRFPLLIVALVSALFAFLFFVMATMDLRRIETVLVGMIEKQGVHQVDRLEAYVLSYFRQLVPDDRSDFGFDPMVPAGVPADEGAVSVQEYLVTDLVDLAREIERMERRMDFSGAVARNTANAVNVSDILFFDEKGSRLYGREPVCEAMMSDARPLIEGRTSVVLRLFKGPYIKEDGGFVGIRRPDGDGAVVLRLDGGALRFWAWKTALTRSVEQMQWHRDVAYLGVYDDAGGVVMETGAAPADIRGVALDEISGGPLERVAASRGVASVRKAEHFEVAAFQDIPGAPRSLVVLGLSMAEASVVLRDGRRHVFVSTGLMIVIGLLAMGVLYTVQNRHLNRVRHMSEQLNKARRLSSLGKLGAGMAHEIRNPLNSISMAAQRLVKEYPATGDKKAGYDRITEVIVLETSRLNRLVDDFLTLSSSGRLRLKRHSIQAVVSRVVFLLGPEADEAGIRITVSGPGGEHGIDRQDLIDPDRMEQALLNIVRNAMESVAGGGEIHISVLCAKGFTTVRIADNGPGIAGTDLDNIFDPSFTTREKGVGLGLAIAHEIISAHDGEIRVESGKSQWTTFEIVIPVR